MRGETLSAAIRFRQSHRDSVRRVPYARRLVAVMSLCPSCGSTLLQPLRSRAAAAAR